MHISRGLSLVEVLVVVAIVGILLALGFPLLNDFLNNAKIRGVASGLRDGLQAARMFAIKQNRTTYFVVSGPGWGVYDHNYFSYPGCQSSIVGNHGCSYATCLIDGTVKSSASACPDYNQSPGNCITNPLKRNAALSGESIVTVMDNTGVISPSSTRVISFTSDGRGQTNQFSISATGASLSLRVLVNTGGMIRICNPNAPTGNGQAC